MPRKLIDQRVEPRRIKTEPRASMEMWLRMGAARFHGSLRSTAIYIGFAKTMSKY